MERIFSRINESERTITQLRESNKKLFALATSAPEVRRLVSSISTLVSKTLKIVKENEETANAKLNLIREKLDELRNSSNIANYFRGQESPSKFVDRIH
jgi:hypothetical protein